MSDNGYVAKDISVLEGLEAVRKRPGMYIGSTGSKGLNHLIYEIVDNSVDEHLAGYCNEIDVVIDDKGYCTVTDNGRGIPVDKHPKLGVSAVEVVFTTLHAGGKFSDDNYKISGGLHGVGSAVVNALSEEMSVTVKRDGIIYEQSFKRGVPQYPLKKVGTCAKKTTGTSVKFLPDDEIFEKISFKSDAVMSRLHEITYINPGLTIKFTDKRKDSPVNAVFFEPDGIRAFIAELNKSKETKSSIISFKDSSDNIEVEIAFQFTDTFEENILGFCNTIFTQEGGSHITGFKSKFTTVINQYARELGILKEKDPNFTGMDVRNGMTAIVAIKHPDPRFEGQTKTKLDNPDAAVVVANITGLGVTHYFDKNQDELKAVIDCAIRSAKVRKAEEKAKVNFIQKSKFSFDGNGKLSNCESKNAKECEIFIVEGDSAGGSAKSARNRLTQAILPIRGKIINVEKAPVSKVLANTEIQSIINAFGCGFLEGYGNDFDIDKLRYDKIIIMTDADVDGSHIDTLLLTFFYRYMPELITHGHIYIATPPLYKVSGKKIKDEYLYDDRALERFRDSHPGEKFDIQRYKGLGEMDPEQLWETTLDPEKRMLKQIEIEDGALASEVTEMLMGSDVPPRKQFIYDHADEAQIDS